MLVWANAACIFSVTVNSRVSARVLSLIAYRREESDQVAFELLLDESHCRTGCSVDSGTVQTLEEFMSAYDSNESVFLVNDGFHHTETIGRKANTGWLGHLRTTDVLYAARGGHGCVHMD